MSLVELDTVSGTAVPPKPRHAITTHLPSWQAILDFIDRKPELMMTLKNMYPRMMVHGDIVELTGHIVKAAGVPEGTGCLLHPSLEAAQQNVAFLTDPRNGDDTMKEEELSLRVFELDVRYYAVFFPAPKTPFVIRFWMDAGTGVSSRMAEESMKHLDKLKELKDDIPPLNNWSSDAIPILQKRIADLLERAPVGGEREKKVQPADVYLYQNGMAAIWWLHEYLNKTRGGSSVLYGFPFHCTVEVLKNWGAGFKHLGSGTSEELDQLDEFCEAEKKEGRSVQAVWAEFPANPMLTTPDLGRLRKLADKHGFILCIDDTVGSFCNIDVMGADGADVVLTSLTKSFNGYAETMGGSTVLNPLSKVYGELKSLMEKRYHNDVYPADLAQLEENSRDYMERSDILNKNAQAVVEYLHSKAQDPDSAIKEVMYPSVHRDRANYEARKRPATKDFTPGYGCLFSVECEDVPTTIAFYDEVGKYIHIGPHLGAHKTLLLCYVKAIYGKELDWVGEFGLNETALRVSVGFQDDPEELLRIFKQAVEAADKKKAEIKEMSLANGSIEAKVTAIS